MLPCKLSIEDEEKKGQEEEYWPINRHDGIVIEVSKCVDVESKGGYCGC
jgi:hypothetical protein